MVAVDNLRKVIKFVTSSFHSLEATKRHPEEGVLEGGWNCWRKGGIVGGRVRVLEGDK